MDSGDALHMISSLQPYLGDRLELMAADEGANEQEAMARSDQKLSCSICCRGSEATRRSTHLMMGALQNCAAR